MRKIFFLIFLLGTLYPSPQLQAKFIEKRAEGWHWYEDRLRHKEEEKKEDEQKQAPSPALSPAAQATVDLKTLQKELEDRKNLAVMQPTYDHIKAYMELQERVLAQSQHFSQMWMKVLYTNPKLDYTVKNPTMQAARHTYLDEEKLATQARIKQLATTHGLFFFFRANCPYCHKFAPIVKGFADKYGWTVVAISMDGSKLPEFPNAQTNAGAAENLKVQHLPALLAVAPGSGSVIPLSYGMTSVDEIENRVKALTVKG